jgi:hypothetical protein
MFLALVPVTLANSAPPTGSLTLGGVVQASVRMGDIAAPAVANSWAMRFQFAGTEVNWYLAPGESIVIFGDTDNLGRAFSLITQDIPA